LLGPVSDSDAVGRLDPGLPALSRMLSRGGRSAIAGVTDGYGALGRVFGLDGPPWPVAAWTRAGEADSVSVEGAWWLRLDPVHLRVDTSHARLFGAWALDLDQAEADGLSGLLNEHLASDRMRIEAAAPGRWYLALAQAQDLATTPVTAVAGRNADLFQPTGADAGAWQRRLTELQMLLHDAPINREREGAGRLPVNSLWPWGGGFLQAPTRAPGAVLADEDPLARGLGRLAGCAVDDAPADLREWPSTGPGETVAVDTRVRDHLVHGEIEAWLEALQRLEAGWFGPALERLQRREIDELVLDPGDGREWHVTRGAVRRFWVRVSPWHRFLAGAE